MRFFASAVYSNGTLDEVSVRTSTSQIGVCLVRYGTWLPYHGVSAELLAAALLGIAVLLAFCGTRMRRTLQLERPKTILTVLLVLIWSLSVATFAVDLKTYMGALFQEYGGFVAPRSPIAPITLLSAVVTFCAIGYLTRCDGLKIALWSALVGCVAAPMIFELPFDIIVMFRLYPPEPAQTLLLFLLPMFLLEFSSLSLLTLSPAMRISSTVLFSLAAMFCTFSAWACFGFAFPASRGPFALNALAKVLSFATVIALFLPSGRGARAGRRARGEAQNVAAR